MKVIQIVGFKNSGKTTLAVELIKKFAEQGYKVGSLKHHGHGGTPLGFQETDSEKHRQAGAAISAVEGDGIFQLSRTDLTMKQMLAVYSMLEIDVVVIEGFKKEPLPKVVLLRQEDDVQLLDQVENVKAVISPLPFIKNDCFPQFPWEERERFFSWLLRNISMNEAEYMV